MYKNYSGFELLNIKTGEVVVYPYIKSQNGRDTEECAIKDQVKLTGLSRSNFMINGLLKR